MRILGIDPGSRALGYGIIDVERGKAGVAQRLVAVAYGVIRPSMADPLARRLWELQTRLGEILREHEPQVGSVERVFVAAHPRSALVLGHARGVALAGVAALGIPVSEYTPTQIKLAVAGGGQADKKQVQGMVQRLLHLEKRPPQDAADALAAAICHAHTGRLAGMEWRGAKRTPRIRSARDVKVRWRR